MLGQPHHQLMKRLARLVEAWANEHRLDLVGVGRLDRAQYILGSERAATAEAPDFVVDLRVEKLDAYAALGVSEVWLYDGSLTVWALETNQRYRRVSRSRYLHALDPALVSRCMVAPTQQAAIDELRSACYSRMSIGYSP